MINIQPLNATWEKWKWIKKKDKKKVKEKGWNATSWHFDKEIDL